MKTQALRNFLDGSKVKKVVFHATSRVFDEFNPNLGDLGVHIGNIDQANYIATNRLSENAYIMPLYINVKNPLRLKDVGSFHADGIAPQMERKKLLPRGDGKRICKEVDLDWRTRKTYDPMLKKIIIEAGYDSIVYQNTHEGKGDSYILFHPTQLKSAIGNNGDFSQKNNEYIR